MSSSPNPRCNSCGMLMLDEAEYGGGNPKNPRCHLCTRPDGSFFSFGETVLSHALYLRSKTGAGPAEAEAAARAILAGNPAWEKEGSSESS